MKKNNKIEKATIVLKKTKYIMLTLAVVMSLMTNTVFAADPLATINGLSDFIFSAIKAIGLILLGFGIVQIGLSLKSGASFTSLIDTTSNFFSICVLLC